MLVVASTTVYRVVDAVWSQARLGLIFWLGCLPIVTAPAAAIWLVHAVRRHHAGDVVPGGREAAWHILTHTMVALRLALVHLAVGLYFLATMNSALPPGPFGYVLQAVVIAALVTWLLTAPWSFLLLEQRNCGVWDAIRSTYLCALRRPMAAMLTLTSLLAGVLLVVLAPTPVKLLAVLVLPPVLVYLALRALAPVQQKYLEKV